MILFIVLVVTAPFLGAQVFPDSKGRDFWFCFLPNFHNSGILSPTARQRDSVYVFVASDTPTSVTLRYTPYDGRPPQVITRRIADPRDMLTISMTFWGIELIGTNSGGDYTSVLDRHTQRPVPYSLHLSSDHDVTVYALNRAQTTSDAFLVLPTDALGRDYYVMSYNTDVVEDSRMNTPSQFAVVAVEDSTVVEFVKLSSQVSDGPVSRVILNQGEVYLVQSRNNSDLLDLTGTRIKSNRPVALFCGHQRVRVPLQQRPYLDSRDCLIEQIPPVNTWGRSAFVVPYPNPPDDPLFVSDRYRILAARDSTLIYRDSLLLTVLNAGEFYEADITGPHAIHANRPFLLAQFRRTASRIYDRNSRRLGDPFMMVIPPSEQFLSSYRFICPQAYEDSIIWGKVTIYKLHYATIVVHDSSKSTVRVDGVVVPQHLFRPIPKSDYVYAWLPLETGVHTVSANSQIGLYVYGYGYADSYGYTGGMSFRRYDFDPPVLSKLPPCPPFRIVVYDTLPTDSKIDILQIQEEESENVRWKISRSTYLPVDSVEIHIELIDPYSDGSITIRASDAERFVIERQIDIPGMTLRAIQGNSIMRLPVRNTYRTATLRTWCFNVPLVNVGKFPITIVSGRSQHGTVTGRVLHATVPPNDTLLLQVCYRAEKTISILDTLWILTPCGRYPASIFEIEFIVDTIAPYIATRSQYCPLSDTIGVSEHGYSQSGIRSITILDSSNIIIATVGGGQKAKSAEEQTLIITQRDWRLDGWYTLQAVDSSGNVGIIKGVFEGHTVMIVSHDSLYPEHRFSGKSGTFICDTIELYNYGLYPKSFERILLRGVECSVPPHVFPLILEPGKHARIPLCVLLPVYDSRTQNTYRDIFELEFRCHRRLLYVSITVLPTHYSVTTSCGVLIQSWQHGEVQPRIEQENSRIFIYVDNTEQWDIRLYTLTGQSIREQTSTEGVVMVDMSDVHAGVYCLVGQSNNGLIWSALMLWLGH